MRDSSLVLQFPLSSFSSLSLPQFLKEEAIFIATISFPRIHTLSFLLKSACHPHHSNEITLSWTPPMTSYCQTQMTFLCPWSSWTALQHETLQISPFSHPKQSTPRFQPQNACILKSARPGFGRSPKLSFLIYEMGLIKPIIYVWHMQVSLLIALLTWLSSRTHYCQINLCKLPSDHVISLFRNLHQHTGTGKLQVYHTVDTVSTVSPNSAQLRCSHSEDPRGLRIQRLLPGLSLASG